MITELVKEELRKDPSKATTIMYKAINETLAYVPFNKLETKVRQLIEQLHSAAMYFNAHLATGGRGLATEWRPAIASEIFFKRFYGPELEKDELNFNAALKELSEMCSIRTPEVFAEFETLVREEIKIRHEYCF